MATKCHQWGPSIPMLEVANLQYQCWFVTFLLKLSRGQGGFKLSYEVQRMPNHGRQQPSIGATSTYVGSDQLVVIVLLCNIFAQIFQWPRWISDHNVKFQGWPKTWPPPAINLAPSLSMLEATLPMLVCNNFAQAFLGLRQISNIL